MDAKDVYAQVFGGTFGRGPAAKVHSSKDGKYTLYGLRCYPPDGARLAGKECKHCAKRRTP